MCALPGPSALAIWYFFWFSARCWVSILLRWPLIFLGVKTNFESQFAICRFLAKIVILNVLAYIFQRPINFQFLMETIFTNFFEKKKNSSYSRQSLRWPKFGNFLWNYVLFWPKLTILKVFGLFFPIIAVNLPDFLYASSSWSRSSSSAWSYFFLFAKIDNFEGFFPISSKCCY